VRLPRGGWAFADREKHFVCWHAGVYGEHGELGRLTAHRPLIEESAEIGDDEIGPLVAFEVVQTWRCDLFTE
jgi:hypothetical protein